MELIYRRVSAFFRRHARIPQPSSFLFTATSVAAQLPYRATPTSCCPAR